MFRSNPISAHVRFFKILAYEYGYSTGRYYRQCDQMAKLFDQFWPYTTMKICPNSIHNLPKLYNTK